MAKDESDPMAFLQRMRERTAGLLEQLDDTGSVSIAPQKEGNGGGGKAASVSTEFRDMDVTVSAPPSNLTPDEEVEWWKRRIQFLSAPIVEPENSAKACGAKETGGDSKGVDSYEISEFKSSSRK